MFPPFPGVTRVGFLFYWAWAYGNETVEMFNQVAYERYLKGDLHVKSRLRRCASGYIERSNQFFTF
ncbi:hypothetical protein BLGI_2768 [Brevibacillus laterosporus GI-9]|nr:hypothetical protein BLGI_2768 [Brevibacillus laterosporus GI-9]